MKLYKCDVCGKTNRQKFDRKFYAHTMTGRFTIDVSGLQYRPPGILSVNRRSDICEECFPDIFALATTSPYSPRDKV